MHAAMVIDDPNSRAHSCVIAQGSCRVLGFMLGNQGRTLAPERRSTSPAMQSAWPGGGRTPGGGSRASIRCVSGKAAGRRKCAASHRCASRAGRAGASLTRPACKAKLKTSAATTIQLLPLAPGVASVRSSPESARSTCPLPPGEQRSARRLVPSPPRLSDPVRPHDRRGRLRGEGSRPVGLTPPSQCKINSECSRTSTTSEIACTRVSGWCRAR